MKINIYGLGYVGSVISICLASLGHEVIGIEVVPEKVDALNSGQLHIYEPGLQELFKSVIKKKTPGTFHAVKQLELYNNADVSIICVGTPGLTSGNIDLGQIEQTIKVIGGMLRHTGDRHDIIVRSTIPPGTTEDIIIPILEAESGRSLGDDFSVCFYPEFLREGQAIHDFFNPSLNIVGSHDDLSMKLIGSIFKKVKKPPIKTHIKTAEMIKYANNTFHALKVTFSNEIATICKPYGVNSNELMRLFCSDNVLNISPYYLRPGFAFGGSCLQKELKGMLYLAKNRGFKPPLLDAIIPSNEEHINRLLSLIENSGGNSICFIGATFKPDTDDIRESPILSAIDKLLHLPSYKVPKRIKIFDQEDVCKKVQKLFKDRIEYTSNQSDFVKSVDVIVLGPKPLNKELVSELLDFEGVIIDLKWHTVPDSLKEKPGYTVIC